MGENLTGRFFGMKTAKTTVLLSCILLRMGLQRGTVLVCCHLSLSGSTVHDPHIVSAFSRPFVDAYVQCISANAYKLYGPSILLRAGLQILYLQQSANRKWQMKVKKCLELVRGSKTDL